MSSDKMIIEKDEILTKMCKNIFGKDIIKNAYVTTWDIGSKKSEIVLRINKEKYNKVESEIDNGAKDIVIEFVNNKMVLFTNSEVYELLPSEWRSIEKATNYK